MKKKKMGWDTSSITDKEVIQTVFVPYDDTFQKGRKEAKLVIHYLDNLDDYRCGMSYWAKFLETDLKDKDGDYIQSIEEMVEECINDGKVKFKKKYGIT